MFTGKCENDDKWVYGDLIHRRIWSSDVTVIRTEDYGFDNYLSYCVKPETVGQCTGYTDKNEKDIAEGHIIDVYLPCDSKHYRGIVRFGPYCSPNLWYETNLGFYVEWLDKDINKRQDFYFWVSAYKDEIEVIGNIHDNSELMEANYES